MRRATDSVCRLSLGRSPTRLFMLKLHLFDSLWICCRAVQQQVVQQVHNNSYKWSLGFRQNALASGGLRQPALPLDPAGGLPSPRLPPPARISAPTYPAA